MSYLKQLPPEKQRRAREMFANGYGWQDIYNAIKSSDIDSDAIRRMYFRMVKRKNFEEFRRRKSA